MPAYVKSAFLGEEDVGRAEFTITRGMAATPLEVVFRPSSPRIDGVVVDADNKPVANAQVTGVPEERFRNRFGDYYVNGQTNAKGEFSIRYGRPGEYTLFAVEGGEPGIGKMVTVDDAFARKHAAEGSALKTEERQRYNVVLRLVKVEER